MTHLNYVRDAIDAGACIYDAWELVKRRLFIYIVAGLIIMIVPSVVPYVGFLLTAPLTGCFAYIVLRDANEDPVDFGTFFNGLEKFLPLLGISVIQALPGFAIVGITLLATAGGYSIFPSAADMVTQDPSGQISFGLTAGVVTWMIGYFLFALFWNLALTFAIPLIVEHNVNIGDAIKLSFGAMFSNFGGLFVLGLRGLLVALIGVLALFVGIFVAVPVIMVANVMAYRQVFPRVTFPPDMPQPAESIYD